MLLLIAVILIAYCLLIIRLFVVWKRIPGGENTSNHLSVSVVIAVRNEAKNIRQLLEDLNRQDYPTHLLELIIVNDQSTDETAEIIKNVSAQARINIFLLALTNDNQVYQSSKKSALSLGISKAKGDLILTTDGDCRLNTRWVSSHAAFYHQEEIVFVTGPVLLESDHSLFYSLQQMEFAALQGVSAALIQLKHPSMCNGANLSFKKAAYLEVNGYDGYGEIISGDDEFLMHKINKRFPDGVGFLKNKQAIVCTAPQPNWIDFYHQRVRWSGKWKRHRNFQNAGLALVIFFTYFAIVAGIVLSLISKFSFLITVILLFFKLIVEYIFLNNVFEFYRKKFHLLHFILLEITYPFYALFFGISSFKGHYQWKQRNYRNQ